ncbi:V-type proton ATPase subunit C 2 [Puma concolor]|uniref:V-type proton ATPase subunit C n=1 Tax=Puma concolor TaxID=9696 RepID=A0A6P6I536_PUMCO|nr:V-type proton ATPase subunit C 2 [Puma concolor]
MSEFWLISAPGDKENLQALERMNTVTSKSNLSYNTKFSIPDFKVGTLDSLVGLSDELGKLDTFAESLIKRMAQSVVEVMEDSKGKVPENLLANGVDLTSFVTHFEWDMAKYPAKQPLVSVVDTLAKASLGDPRPGFYGDPRDGSAPTSAGSPGSAGPSSPFRSAQGSRVEVCLRRPSDYNIGREVDVAGWFPTNELCPASLLIAEDNEGGLFTVTLFRKVIDDFKTKAKENKFTVREFYYDEKEIKREREELSRLLSDKKQQYQTSCVALKKGSSTFPDHKVQVTPLGNPDRPAAGQTDRERESEGEGEVAFEGSNQGAQHQTPFLLIRGASLELPPAPGSGWCLLARVPPALSGDPKPQGGLRCLCSLTLASYAHSCTPRRFWYGLPVNFQAVLLQPHKKSSTKRLREVLNSVFRHLDQVAAASVLDASVDIPGLQLGNQDYFPYVYFHIDLSLLD